MKDNQIEKGFAYAKEQFAAAGVDVEAAMGEAGKAFIANWESEKYRKSLAGKKG